MNENSLYKWLKKNKLPLLLGIGKNESVFSNKNFLKNIEIIKN
jgi:hypothetical protein